MSFHHIEIEDQQPEASNPLNHRLTTLLLLPQLLLPFNADARVLGTPTLIVKK
jgi:hypothetical protein